MKLVTVLEQRCRFHVVSLIATSLLMSACVDPGNGNNSGNPRGAAIGAPIASPRVSLVADSTTVPYNSTTTIRWESTFATVCSASGAWSGEKETSGSEQVGPLTEQTSYTITCDGSGTSDTQTVVIQVSPPAAPVLTLSATPDVVPYGETTQLDWSAQHVEGCTASGAWAGIRDGAGSVTTEPLNADSTFALTCTGSGGSITRSVSVDVGAPPADKPAIALSASPARVAYDGSTTLTWSVTNSTECTASGDWSGSRPTSGSHTASNLTTNSAYTLTCIGPGGTASLTVNVGVDDPPAPSLAFGAESTVVDYNRSTTLEWAASDATSCTASNAWSGTKGTIGTESTGPMTSDASYTLSCSGAGGGVRRTVSISVNPPPAPIIDFSGTSTTVASGETATLIWSVTNANTCSASGGWQGTKSITGTEEVGPLSADTHFVLSCEGPGGTQTESVSVAIAPIPSISLSANPQTVTSGGHTTVSWTADYASTCEAGGAWSGTKATSGSETIGPFTENARITMTCSGTGGNVTRSMDITLAEGTGSVNVSWTPPSTRTDGSTLENLRGFKVYYGTATGDYTDTVTVADSNSTSHDLTDLTPGTYYFAVTAYDDLNRESDYSTEVSITIN